MTENSKYFVLKKKAVPEVLLKVVEAKRLLDCNPGMTVQEAADQLGISRSSFYKYKEDIFPFHDEAKGKTVTFMLQVEDEPGLLSTVQMCIRDRPYTRPRKRNFSQSATRLRKRTQRDSRCW